MNTAEVTGEGKPAAPIFSASLSIILKFSALFTPRPPVTTIRAFPRSGRSEICAESFTYVDLATDSSVKKATSF